MRRSIVVSTVLAAAGLLALTSAAQAVPIVINDVCSTSNRTAAFDGSCYIGADDHNYGDVIGNVSKFGITSAEIDKQSADTFTVKINTAYAGKDGTFNTHYGALFLDQEWRAGSNDVLDVSPVPFDPNFYDTTVAGQNNNYLKDKWISGDWGFVFVPDDYSPGTGDKSGSGSLYAVQEENLIFADDAPLSGTWRKTNSTSTVSQVTQYAVNGVAVDGVALSMSF